MTDHTSDAFIGFVKAQYTVGYFTETGIGCQRDILEANLWYVKAADNGDERAKLRLAAIRAAVSGGGGTGGGAGAGAGAGAGGTPMEVAAPRSAKMRKAPPKEGKDEKDCVIM